jgi:hypothetical protein
MWYLTMDNAAIDIGRAAVVFPVMARVLLCFSRVSEHLGKLAVFHKSPLGISPIRPNL